MISDYGNPERGEKKGAPEGSIMGPACWNLSINNQLQMLQDGGVVTGKKSRSRDRITLTAFIGDAKKTN